MIDTKMKKNEGSALLVALIIMGILLSLSLGVSDLLVGTMRDNRMLLEKTHAWYAAESGIEHALYAISQHAPGFETSASAEFTNTDSRYEYQIKATAGNIPSKEVYEIVNEEDSDSYAVLRLNESITIPLFRGSGEENSVSQFKVDYYLTPTLRGLGGNISDDLDILRWKIFGISADAQMEVLNEFLPANQGNSSQNPTCFGTIAGCYNAAQFNKRVTTGNDGSSEFLLDKIYPIETFLQNHTQNFLVLTNVVNTDLIVGSLSTRQKQQIATIRYRVTETSGKSLLTLPYIKITADGYGGSTKQSLDLEVKRESFLPVFNYSLYRTAE